MGKYKAEGDRKEEEGDCPTNMQFRSLPPLSRFPNAKKMKREKIIKRAEILLAHVLREIPLAGVAVRKGKKGLSLKFFWARVLKLPPPPCAKKRRLIAREVSFPTICPPTLTHEEEGKEKEKKIP